MNEADDSFPVYPTGVPRRNAADRVPSPDPADLSPVEAGRASVLDSAVVPSPARDTQAATPDTPAKTSASATPSSMPEELTEKNTSLPSDDIEIADDKQINTDAQNKKSFSTPSLNVERTATMSERIASTFENRIKALRARVERRDTKLARIVEFARNRGSVRNDDIKRILRVSDATATRYARLLVQRGELIEHGKGRSVTYTVSK